MTRAEAALAKLVRTAATRPREDRTIILPPAIYEEWRAFLDIQPARVKDSRGAHIEVD